MNVESVNPPNEEIKDTQTLAGATDLIRTIQAIAGRTGCTERQAAWALICWLSRGDDLTRWSLPFPERGLSE